MKAELGEALARVVEMSDDEVCAKFNRSVLPVPLSAFSTMKWMPGVTVQEMMRASVAAVAVLEVYEASHRPKPRPVRAAKGDA